MKTEDAHKLICSRGTISDKDKDWLYVIMYKVYYEGLQQGREQVKEQMHVSLDKLLGDN